MWPLKVTFGIQFTSGDNDFSGPKEHKVVNAVQRGRVPMEVEVVPQHAMRDDL